MGKLKQLFEKLKGFGDLDTASLKIFGSALMLFFVLGGSFLYLTPTITHPTSNAELSRTSVKVVRSDGRSGGTGVILKSSTYESQVLTNNHVCQVIKNGGSVISDTVTTAVTGYQESRLHDLCLITVARNLGVNTEIASSAPEANTDATISGHPRLYPNIITKGNFSGREIIPVMLGIKPCSPEELNEPQLAPYCLFMGGLPIVRKFEAQVVGATIQPGSSGSAVFNNKGEISALVFAGAGDLAYAFTVPYESIATFLNQELKDIPLTPPNDILNINPNADKDSHQAFEENCRSPQKDSKFKELCEIYNRSLLWTK